MRPRRGHWRWAIIWQDIRHNAYERGCGVGNQQRVTPGPGESADRIPAALSRPAPCSSHNRPARCYIPELWVLNRTLRILFGDVGQVVKGIRQSVNRQTRIC